MKIKLYGLKHRTTDLLAQWETFSNAGGEDCNEVGVDIRANDGCDDHSRPWLTESIEKARRAVNTSEDWFNACYGCPRHGSGFVPGDHVVVEVEISY